MAKKLTVRGLTTIKPAQNRKEHPDGLVSGLYHIVQPSGKASWAVRYRMGGRTRKHTLGSASAIDLVNARELAREALVEVAKGNDPGEAKKAARKAKPKLTLEELTTTYVEKYAKRATKTSVAHETERALRTALKRLEKRPAEAIVRRDLKDIIEDRLTDGQTATAIRLRALFSKMFKWAVEEEYLTINPCMNLPSIKAPESIERNLSASEIHAVVNCACSYDMIFGRYLLFLLCTGQRRTMTAETTWAEINFSNRIWKISKERTKNKREHIVHLSKYVMSILNDIWDDQLATLSRKPLGTDPVFRNFEGNPISGFSDRKNSFDEYLKKNGHNLEPWTLHDLRRTASTSLSELGVEQVIIDLILSHQTARTKDVSLIYNRNQNLKKRSEAMERWGDYIHELSPWGKPIDRGAFGEEKIAQDRK